MWRQDKEQTGEIQILQRAQGRNFHPTQNSKIPRESSKIEWENLPKKFLGAWMNQPKKTGGVQLSCNDTFVKAISAIFPKKRTWVANACSEIGSMKQRMSHRG